MDDQADVTDLERPVLRRARVLLPAVTSLVLFAGLAVGFHRWTHPSLFQDNISNFTAAPQPMSNFPFYVGVGAPKQGSGRETITINEAHVVFSPNTARASGTLAICTRREVAEGTLTLGLTTDDDAPVKQCTNFRIVRPGTKLTYFDGKNSQYLVLIVKPARSGTARLRAVDLDYTRGWNHLSQHGTQRLVQDVILQAS